MKKTIKPVQPFKSLVFVLGVVGLGLIYDLTQNMISPLPLQGQISVCFTPNKKCQDLLLKAINSTQKSIKVQAYSLKDPDVINALIDVQKSGKSVQILLDKEHLHGKSKSILTDLKAAGILVKIEKTSGLSHNKVMIIDEKTIVTGSYNFSKGAYKRNSENLLILSDETLSKQYLENFEKLWGK